VLVRMWKDWNFHILFAGLQNGATTMENSLTPVFNFSGISLE